MRYKRYPDCSRPNSRRNSAIVAVVPILLQLVSVCAFAQEARLDAVLRGGRVYAAVEYLDVHSQEVLASLRDGLRAEIIFQLRLYKRSSGVFAFLGDRLLSEKRVYKVASFDFYENRYKILKGDTTVGDYAGEAEFLDAFFSVGETDLGRIDSGERRDHYLLARVRMMPVKIIAPLNIITLFSSEAVFTTPWTEAELSP
jgi:hypothetical protein